LKAKKNLKRIKTKMYHNNNNRYSGGGGGGGSGGSDSRKRKPEFDTNRKLKQKD
jgi:hypothetical protein